MCFIFYIFKCKDIEWGACVNERMCEIYTVPKSGEKKSLMPFFFAGCGSAVRGCKTSPLNGIYN